MTATQPDSAASGKVKARAYTSPTLVLLAMDWPEGAKFDDFLGFAILRSPGFVPNEKDGYLLNKIGFQPPGPNSQSLPSSLSPIQKFLWWDSSITDATGLRQFEYTITPVRGMGPGNLTLVHQAEVTISVTVPNVKRDGIATWFNRAVVSSQGFDKAFPDPQKALGACMEWLANGMQDAFPAILKGASEIDGAIYHLTDKEWVVPALKGFGGPLSVVYEDRPNDTTDRPAIKLLKSDHFAGFPRSKTNIMHDKFLVDAKGGRVLTGSANFTPEGLTSQANVLHIFSSPQLAGLYSAREKLLQSDPPVKQTAQSAAWSSSVKVGKAKVRVFFSPEPANSRVSIDTVISAINKARQSVIFCMFDPTDPALLTSLMEIGDRGKLLYGMLNSISDPAKASKKAQQNVLSDSGEPPRKPSASAQIRVTLYNRSRQDKKILAYSYFQKGDTPAGFLPELSTVDLSSMSTLPPSKRPAPAVHIHHKFIVIDAETDTPIIYTGSANLSANSTNHNDENLLEITGSPELAQTYFAEFMRLYEHYRARALWHMARPQQKPPRGKQAPPGSNAKLARTFTLKTKRDDWVKGAYKPGTPEYLARTALA
jgi:phosphatidylserine/phosphatidylglycerophosphate/cardiolipin synthase-like enzyme